ncbi:MAG: hypothetical protein ABEH43_00120, partial [Flavobacteriales bacterium]
WSVVSNGNITAYLTDSIVVDDTGTYQLIVTDPDNGCEDTNSVIVEIDTASPTSTINGADTITCSKQSDTLIGTGSSTNSGNINYSWSVVNNGNINNDLGDSIIVDDTGTYKLVVTDPVSGCQDSMTTVVETDTASPSPAITDVDNILCSRLTDTLLGINSTTNSGNITYTWSASGGGNIINDLGDSIIVDTSGTYKLVVTDPVSGCKDSTTVNVTHDTVPPTADITGEDTITCTKNTDTLDGSGSTSNSGNLNYNWSVEDNGGINGSTTDDSAIVNDTGTYQLLVTDPANNCQDSTTTIVEIDTATPEAFLHEPDTFGCNTDSVVLADSSSTTSSGNINYTWNSVTGGNILSGQGTDSAWVDAPGDYELIVEDPVNGCTDNFTDSAKQENNVPNAVINNPAPDTLNCDKSIDTLDATSSSTSSGETVWYWTVISGGNLTDTVNFDSSAVIVDGPGDYEVIVKDTNNGCKSSSTYTQLQDTASPTASIAQPDTFFCSTDSVVLSGSGSTPSGDITFNWISNGPGIITSGDGTDSAWVNDSGNYELAIEDTTNGCVDTASIIVRKDTNKPSATIYKLNNDSILTCDNDTVTLYGDNSTTNSTKIEYDWLTSNGNIVGSTTDTAANVIEDGDYELAVTDPDNNCSDTSSIIVRIDTAAPQPFPDTPSDFTCYTDSVMLADSASTTTSGDSSYTWSSISGGSVTSGQNNDTAWVNDAGTYRLKLTDNFSGCEDSTTIVVEDDTGNPSAAIVNPAPDTLIHCNTDSIDLDGSSSTPDSLSYKWNGSNILSSDTDSTVLVGDSGVHALMITDTTNGCQDSATIYVPLDTTDPIASAVINDTIPCSGDSILIDASGSSPAGIDYSWNGNGIVNSNVDSSNVWVNQSNNFTLTVTDTMNFCTDDTTVKAEEDTAVPDANVLPVDSIDCNVSTVDIDASNSGPVNDITYSWSVSAGG